MKKIKQKIITSLKQSYKVIIFLIIFFLILNFPIPYYIFSSGGISNLSDRFEIQDGYKLKGSYNLSYVTQLNGNVLTYLISVFNHNWDTVKISDYQYNETETLEELANRDVLELNSANQAAIKVAYTKAEKEYTINNKYYYVFMVDPILKSSKKIKVGDRVEKYDSKEFTEFQELSNYISNTTKDKITFTMLRNSQEYDVDININVIENRKLLGIEFIEIDNYNTNPEIKMKFENKESGPSAGFMTSLAIYDTLIEEDLTHGLKIAGTGTIDFEGNVGQIGGVKYKLKGAVKNKADIFFVPSGNNYDECIELQKEYDYDIKIIEIKKIDDAIEYLKNIKE